MSAALGIFLRKVSRLLPKGRCRTDKLHGVIKHRSSHEPTMVGRGASLHGRLFLGGTDGSNPVPSRRESATNRGLQPRRGAADPGERLYVFP
jgi:hypothetical protein